MTVKEYSYTTQGVCSKNIDLKIDNGIITEVIYHGGCHGNLQGIGSLVKGMRVDEVIRRLDGLKCKQKDTSCPDQLAKALHCFVKEERENGKEDNIIK